MAEDGKLQLTEEEKIERKVRIRRIISNILIVIGVISLIIFVVLALMTRGNIQTQTAMDTQELRSKLKNIISLEKRYHKENGKYAQIKFLSRSKEIERYNPSVDGNFKYSFDPDTGIATGMEKDASHDVNGDNDGRDGLTLDINLVAGKTDNSDFFWTEEDLKAFEKKSTR